MDALRSKGLREKRANLVELNKGALAKIDEEKDAARVKELETEWDARDNEIVALTKQIERAEKQEHLEAEQEQPVRRTEIGRVLPQSKLNAEQRKEQEARYRRVYWDNLRGFALEPDDMALLATRRMSIRGEFFDVDKRAQALVPTSAGGFGVPQGFVAELVKDILTFGGVRPMARILSTQKGNKLPWPTVTDVANEAVIVGEGLTGGAADMAFGEIVFNAYTYRTIVLASFELLNDEDVNLEAFIRDAITERFARGTNRHYTVGDGATQPQGFITKASSGATSSAAAVIDYGALVDLEHSVDAGYRAQPGCGYQMHDFALKIVKKLVDTQQRPLWVPGIAVNAPDTILGYPYGINNHMATPAAASKSVAFGDFKRHVIRDVNDMLIVRANELHLANGQVGFYAFFRTDSRTLDAGTDPIKFLTQGA